MTEKELEDQLHTDPFVAFRIHLVSGKTVDVLAPHAAWTLNQSLLVFRNPSSDTTRAEGYDVIAYPNIERLEQLPIGKRPAGKRKPA
ncbi:hypothetical protein [Humisphaera borealis]|uniref:Uncharacterized protein n=1 Tax=Humisphaera borealis TaxID=2807512 RepID=A0A7M2X177_9BACT|nr:hypothetical protein [Humisphaera borealis]QOV91498.1 hypothetical protein IPV69_09130 [Humisphaera borealis]